MQAASNSAAMDPLLRASRNINEIAFDLLDVHFAVV